MRKVLWLAAAAAVLFAGGCAGAPPSAQSFATMAGGGVNVDFDPLATPTEAVGQGDLIVEGTLESVGNGISLRFTDPAYTQRWANSYATVVITVDSVLSGNPNQVRGGKVYVEILKNKAVSPQQLAGANPHPRVVAVLDDITAWSPGNGVDVVRPDAVPAAAPLFAPYTDGFWLQASSDTRMYGLGAEPEHLGPAWNQAATVAEYAAAIRQAVR